MVNTIRPPFDKKSYDHDESTAEQKKKSRDCCFPFSLCCGGARKASSKYEKVSTQDPSKEKNSYLVPGYLFNEVFTKLDESSKALVSNLSPFLPEFVTGPTYSSNPVLPEFVTGPTNSSNPVVTISDDLAKRLGFRSTIEASMMELANVTNERYQNTFVPWTAPKGLFCGGFPGALPAQHANLYPDMFSIYFVIPFMWPDVEILRKTLQALIPGSKTHLSIDDTGEVYLEIKGVYPYARYFSLTIANQLGGGQIGNGLFLRGDQIEPDEGSFNPFNPAIRRNVPEGYRNYTIRIVQKDFPKDPRKVVSNTLYAGKNYKGINHLSIRTYLADAGRDGTGVIPLNQEGYGLPMITLNLPEEKKIDNQKDLIEILRVKKDGDPNGYTFKRWNHLVNTSWNPEIAPCYPIPLPQLFFNTDYSITGSFIRDFEERVRKYPATNTGGFANNPDTCYLVAPLSFSFGPIAVFRMKVPTHPATWEGQDTLPKDPNVQWFSVSTAAAPYCGRGYDTVGDQEFPVGKDGFITVVVTRSDWDRPSNARIKDGVVYLRHGTGESPDYPEARNTVGILYIRYQAPSPNWKNSPKNIPEPTPEHPIPQDPRIMKEYYPLGDYTSKAKFENDKDAVFSRIEARRALLIQACEKQDKALYQNILHNQVPLS